MARWLPLVVSSALALGCAGGQTGEITEPSTCGEVSAVVAFADLAPDEAAGIERALDPWSGALAWDAGGASAAHVAISRRGDSVERAGHGGCAHVLVPVLVTLATDDGRLDEQLEGELAFHGADSMALHATAPVGEMSGELDLSHLGPMPDGELYLVLGRDEGGLDGQLFVRPSAEEDEIRLGAL